MYAHHLPLGRALGRIDVPFRSSQRFPVWHSVIIIWRRLENAHSPQTCMANLLEVYIVCICFFI
jgi:hypothetical protein